jgi:hypothetical protein
MSDNDRPPTTPRAPEPLSGEDIPVDNQPGHHPEHEQDQPDLDAFAERLGTTTCEGPADAIAEQVDTTDPLRSLASLAVSALAAAANVTVAAVAKGVDVGSSVVRFAFDHRPGADAR